MPISTRHDPTKVMLGASLCPAHEEAVESVPGNIAAGLVVRQNTSTGAYQVTNVTGGPILGVSRGRSLGGAGTFSLVRRASSAVIQIGAHEPVVGTQVHVDNTTGVAAASGGSATATAAVYKKILIGGGVNEATGEAVNVAIIDLTSGF